MNGSDTEANDVALTSLRKLYRAAEDLKAELSVDEASFKLIAPEAHSDSRGFYIFEALDEIQKMTCALLPLSALPGPEEQSEAGDPTTRIIKEAFVDQSALWQRKLAEILAEVVCFRTTPETDYYLDYLLLARLDQVLGIQADQRNFWGAESENLAHQIRALQKQIKSLEGTGFDLGRAWYRGSKKPLRDDPRPGQLFASFNQRLMHALGEGTDTEKVALGLSYGAIFARASASLHARPGRLERLERQNLMGHLQIPILIGLNVLVGCQKILNKVPGEHNEFFRRALEQNPQATKQLGRITEQRAEVGDLVFAHGELCEVLEVVSGPYGYKAYKVRYLTRRLIPEIGEDYVVAPQIAVILNIEQARQMVREQVKNGHIRKEVGDHMLALPDHDLIAVFRESTVELWNAGVGFKESITERLIRPPD